MTEIFWMNLQTRMSPSEDAMASVSGLKRTLRWLFRNNGRLFDRIDSLESHNRKRRTRSMGSSFHNVLRLPLRD